MSAARTLSGIGALERHVHTLQVTEARRIDRLLNVHPEDEQIQQQLRVSLRLHRAAHESEAHVWRVRASVSRRLRARLGDEARNERVERTLARRHGIRQSRLHRESCAAILQREAGARHHDP